MGGFGSGCGGGAARATCEDYYAIDLAWLRRQGARSPGHSGRVTWSRAGRETGSITYRIERDGVRLIYRSRAYGGDWEDVDELVPFVYTATRFGGRRQWFQCRACGKGCRVLHGGARYRCRRCHGLAYNSQREAWYQRALDQARRISKRLGGNSGAFDEFPPKPKRMRWATYWRLEERYTALLNQGMAGAYSHLLRL
jgi:hypothetical protein